MIQKQGANHKSKGFELPEKIPYHTQQKTLVAMGGYMRNIGAGYEAIEAALWEVNQTQCEKPGPRKNIQQYARSVCKYDVGKYPTIPENPEYRPRTRPGAARKHSPATFQDKSSVDQNVEQPEFSLEWPASLAPAAFRGIAGDLIDIIRPHSEADEAALLIQFLVAMGNVIGRNAHFVAQGAKHFMNLYAVLVGETARGRKGSSQEQIHLPMRLVDSDWASTRCASGLSSGEGLIFKVRDAIEKQEPIKEKGRVVSYQKVIADPGEDDKRLLVIEPEFGRVLQVIERETNILSPVMRQAWDSGNLQTLTRNSPLAAAGAHISIVGHITRSELDRYLTDCAVANGFANRFLWVCVRRSQLLPEGGELHRVDLGPSAKQLMMIVECARGVGEMRRHESAREQWKKFYERCARGGSGLFDSVTSRAEAQTMRLACLYALCDQQTVVRECHLDAAMALWKYCEASARFLFGGKLGDPTADQILAELRGAAAQGLTRSDISNSFGRNKPAFEIDRALGVLQGRALVSSQKEETSGRPVTRWFAI